MKVYVETLYHYSCNCNSDHTIANDPPTIGQNRTCPSCKKDSLLSIIEYPSKHLQMTGKAKIADIKDS